LVDNFPCLLFHSNNFKEVTKHKAMPFQDYRHYHRKQQQFDDGDYHWGMFPQSHYIETKDRQCYYQQHRHQQLYDDVDPWRPSPQNHHVDAKYEQYCYQQPPQLNNCSYYYDDQYFDSDELFYPELPWTDDTYDEYYEDVKPQKYDAAQISESRRTSVKNNTSLRNENSDRKIGRLVRIVRPRRTELEHQKERVPQELPRLSEITKTRVFSSEYDDSNVDKIIMQIPADEYTRKLSHSSDQKMKRAFLDSMNEENVPMENKTAEISSFLAIPENEYDKIDYNMGRKRRPANVRTASSKTLVTDIEKGNFAAESSPLEKSNSERVKVTRKRGSILQKVSVDGKDYTNKISDERNTTKPTNSSKTIQHDTIKEGKHTTTPNTEEQKASIVESPILERVEKKTGTQNWEFALRRLKEVKKTDNKRRSGKQEKKQYKYWVAPIRAEEFEEQKKNLPPPMSKDSVDDESEESNGKKKNSLAQKLKSCFL